MTKHDTPGIKQGPVPRSAPTIADLKYHDKIMHQRTNQSSQDEANGTAGPSNDKSQPAPPTLRSDASNDNPALAPPPPPPADFAVSSETDSTLPADGNRGTVSDNTPHEGNDTPTRVQRILEQMLSPPDSDIAPGAGNQDIHCRHQFQRPPPTIKLGPFLPQPDDPSKQRRNPFNHRRNLLNCRYNFRGNNYNTGNGGGNGGNDRDDGNAGGGGNDNGTSDSNDNVDDNSQDGDDELDDDSSAPADTPSTTNSTTTASRTPTQHNPPPSRPITRSQSKRLTTPSPSPTTSNTTPSPKRKRASSVSNPISPAKGDRVSKRIRHSFSESSPLPEPLELKRTRSEQKKFEEKLSKDHVFDPLHAGSVRREVIEAKSGAKEWKKETLHQEPWDGSQEQ